MQMHRWHLWYHNPAAVESPQLDPRIQLQSPNSTEAPHCASVSHFCTVHETLILIALISPLMSMQALVVAQKQAEDERLVVVSWSVYVSYWLACLGRVGHSFSLFCNFPSSLACTSSPLCLIFPRNVLTTQVCCSASQP